MESAARRRAIPAWRSNLATIGGADGARQERAAAGAGGGDPRGAGADDLLPRTERRLRRPDPPAAASAPAATRPSSSRSACCRGPASPAPPPGSTSPATSSGLARPAAGLPRPALGPARRNRARGQRPGADPGDLRLPHLAAARRRLPRRRRPPDRLPDGRLDGRDRRLLGLLPGAALQEPVGGPADAGRDDGADPHHHRLRAAGAAEGWLQKVARVNPVTQVVEAARQGFVGEVSWAETWPGLLALAGMLAILGALALREMRRTAVEPGGPSPLCQWSAAGASDRARPSASCGRTGSRASATGSASPTPSRAPAATPGSGTGTPASRRSSGAASTPTARGPSWRACWPPSAPTASSATRSSGTGRSPWTASPFYNVASRSALQTETIQPPLLAWAWRIAVGDPAEEPRIARPARLARRQPRPRGRRAALDRPARRVGPRRLAQVRPGLGTARQRPARLPAAGAPQPPARLRRPPDPRPRRPRPLRDPGQHDVVALAAGDGTTLGDRRPWSSGSGTSAADSSSTRRSPAASGPTSSPGPRWRRSPCPTCRRRSAGAWSRSTC